MATTTLTRRQPKLNTRWLVAGILVIALSIGGALAYNRTQTQSTARAAAPATTPVIRGTLIQTVAGSGTVNAAQALDVPFQTSGTVTEVLVKVGDTVTAGQALAKLDDQQLQLALSNAQAALNSATAKLAQTQQGNTTPEAIAAAQAAVTQAQASYDKIAAGATADQIKSAQAAVTAAQANYNKAATGASAAQIQSAKSAVASAQAAYDAAVKAASTTSSQLNSAKAAMEKAAAAVQQAQAAYDKVKSAPDIGARTESVNLENATLAYEQAKADYNTLATTVTTDNQSKIASAQAQLDSAKASLNTLQTQVTQADLTSSAAAITQAQASLDALKNQVTKPDLASAQASIDAAKANLAKLTAPSSDSDVAIQQAAVAQAQEAVKQAQLNLANATLKAPFSGVLTAVNVVPGSSASTSTAAVSVMDRSTLHVDLKLSENDITKVKLGQPVTLTINSLTAWAAQGIVSYIAPSATTTNNVVTYAVRVDFPGNDAQVKVGMTANVTIVTANDSNVLLVPNAALLPSGNGHVVQVLDATGTGTHTVQVQTGLSDSSKTEITGGLTEGQKIIALPSTTTTTRTGGGGPGLFGIGRGG